MDMLSFIYSINPKENPQLHLELLHKTGSVKKNQWMTNVNGPKGNALGLHLDISLNYIKFLIILMYYSCPHYLNFFDPSLKPIIGVRSTSPLAWAWRVKRHGDGRLTDLGKVRSTNSFGSSLKSRHKNGRLADSSKTRFISPDDLKFTSKRA